MKTKFVSNLSFLIIFIIIIFTATAQQWSDPVNISNNYYTDGFHDFIMDNNSVLHCVWIRYIESNYTKIYYSKSDDNGETWSLPLNISENYVYSLANAQIINNSENNLYVTYDYNVGDYYNTEVHIRKYDGNTWSDAINISEGYPGANNNRLVIDNNDRIYVFWNYWGCIYYRYYDNDQWSNVLCPYNTTDFVFIEKLISDVNNDLHCAGYHYLDGQSSEEMRIAYFQYTENNNTWSDIQIISNNHLWHGLDIDLNIDLNPNITWCQYIWDSILPPPYGTFFSFYDGSEWINDSVIAINTKYPTLKIIENQPLLLTTEYYPDNNDLLYFYKKNISGNWIVLDTLGFPLIRTSKIIYDENYLYLTLIFELHYEIQELKYLTEALVEEILLLKKKQPIKYFYFVQ